MYEFNAFSDLSTVVGFRIADYQPEREVVSEIVLPVLQNKGMGQCFALDMIHASGQVTISASMVAVNVNEGESTQSINEVHQEQNKQELYMQSTPLGPMKNKIYVNTYVDEHQESLDEGLDDIQVTLTVTDVLREGSQLTAAFSNLRQCPNITDECNTGVLEFFASAAPKCFANDLCIT